MTKEKGRKKMMLKRRKNARGLAYIKKKQYLCSGFCAKRQLCALSRKHL